MAIEAALEAERMHQERQDDQQRILDLDGAADHSDSLGDSITSSSQIRFSVHTPSQTAGSAIVERSPVEALPQFRTPLAETP
jgi:hypothetical protein